MLLWHCLLFYSFIHAATADYFIACRNPTDQSKVDYAITEAINWAQNALYLLGDLSLDTTKAAFDPFFQPSDVPTLITLYSAVRDLPAGSLQVKFYCTSSDFEHWSSKYNGWADMQYTYKDKRGIKQVIGNYYIELGPGSSQTNPPSSRGSYTTLGFKQKLKNGDVADFSEQAHVYLNPKRVNPPANSVYDHRSLNDIRSNGLNEGFNALDTLKPLAETIFHEAMHAVGGRISDDRARPRITDGPNKDTYKYQKCAALNANRGPTTTSPTQVADCLMLLAKAKKLLTCGGNNGAALYITRIKAADDPDNKLINAYWSLGAVDRKTGAPIEPTPQPVDRRWLVPVRWWA
ncbi:hypothetical protein F4680DRAFT_466146 [Xylaria scruposa]|nr:hypothetical protein F4680DRAFT_466146 [Xylaria scruposa]